MKRKVTFFLVFLLSVNLFSQVKNDLFINRNSSVKDYFIASGEMLFFNLLVYDGVNLFSTNPPKTSFEIFKKNFTIPWIFDFSSFQRNQLYHPYFGSLYFISGRSNNLNFLESTLLTFTGSFIWETYLEGPTVSKNDLITTTISGAITGEVLHRLSYSAYNSAPFVSWILSPVDAMNELLRGKRASTESGTIYSQSYSALAGFTAYNSSTDNFILPQAGAAINVIYGNPFGHTTKEFYDQFQLDLYYSGWKNNNFLKLYIDGLLYSHTIFPAENVPSTLGLTLDYDVIYSNYETLSNGSVGICLKQNFNDSFWYSLQADYIYLSTSDLFYIINNEPLHYSLPASQALYTYKYGPEFKLSLGYSNEKFGNINLSSTAQYAFTYSNSTKDKNLESNVFLFTLDTSYEHAVYKDFYLGLRHNFILKKEINNPLVLDLQTINKTDLYIKYYIN
ncbi:MAG: DUF3943 domain-containing protein [Treponema sp.]|nr:DUF3943 domain-containing protein [Treponema sp.]